MAVPVVVVTRMVREGLGQPVKAITVVTGAHRGTPMAVVVVVRVLLAVTLMRPMPGRVVLARAVACLALPKIMVVAVVAVSLVVAQLGPVVRAVVALGRLVALVPRARTVVVAVAVAVVRQAPVAQVGPVL